MSCRPLGPLLLTSLLFKIVAGGLLLCFLLSCTGGEQERLAIGDQAPPFALQDLAGNTVRLADFAGAPVILRFFLTDCKYCRADTPVFNDYFHRYGDQGLGVLYIDAQGTGLASLENFAERLAIAFPVLRDEGGKTAAAYRVKAMPQTIVLDPQHRIVGAILGSVGTAELDRLLGSYLSGAQENGSS